MEEIKDSVLRFIIETTYSANSQIKDDTLIFKDGYFDSMGFVSLITFLEEKFNIRTTDRDLLEENFESINAIAQFVSRKKDHNIRS